MVLKQSSAHSGADDTIFSKAFHFLMHRISEPSATVPRAALVLTGWWNSETAEKNSNNESRNGENGEGWRSCCSTWSFNQKEGWEMLCLLGVSVVVRRRWVCANELLRLTEWGRKLTGMGARGPTSLAGSVPPGWWGCSCLKLSVTKPKSLSHN